MARLNSTTINGGLEVNGGATINENLTVMGTPIEINHVVRLGDFNSITVDGGLTLKDNNGNIITGDVILSHATPESEITNLKATNERIYVTGLEFDNYGHVTGYATGKEEFTIKSGNVTFGANDAVEFVAGDNVTVTPDTDSKTITISAQDTHNSHKINSGLNAAGIEIMSASASSGDITLGDSGVTAGEYGPTSDQIPAYGDTFNVPDIEVNLKGIVTSVTNRTVKIPTNTTYTLSAPKSKSNGSVTIDLTAGGSGSGTNSVAITGDGATNVTTDTDGSIIISSPTYESYEFSSTTQGNLIVTPSSGTEITVDIFELTTGGSPIFKKVNAESFTATSDKRLKENIKEFTPQKSILNLPVVEFDFKESKVHQIGCLAQDLQEICPEIVVEGDDGYLSIQESKIIYLLLLEVKKLKEEISNLRG